MTIFGARCAAEQPGATRGWHSSRNTALCCAAVLLVTACPMDCTDPASPPAAAGRVLWGTPLPAHTGVAGLVAVTPGGIYAATDTGLSALDPATGALRWFVPATGMGGSRRMEVRNSRVFTAGTYAVRAHDVATGAVLWENTYDPASADLGGVSADDQAVFVGLRDGRVLALAQSDGHVLWQVQIATPEWQFRGDIAGTTVSGDTLFVAADRSLTENNFQSTVVVVALDRQTGRELWRYQYAGTDMATNDPPALVGGKLVMTDVYAGYVLALDAATGSQQWLQRVWGRIYSAPAVRGDTVFVATAASRAYALDAHTGRVLWTAITDGGAVGVAPCGTEVFVQNFHVEVRRADNGHRVGIAFPNTYEEVATSGVTVAGRIAYVGTNKRLLALRCE